MAFRVGDAVVEVDTAEVTAIIVERGPPGERGNRRGRGGFGGGPRSGRGGGFGQQQVCRCQVWFFLLIYLLSYMLKLNLV